MVIRVVEAKFPCVNVGGFNLVPNRALNSSYGIIRYNRVKILYLIPDNYKISMSLPWDSDVWEIENGE